MKKYDVSVTLEDWDRMEIEAESKEDAERQAIEYYRETYPRVIVDEIVELDTEDNRD